MNRNTKVVFSCLLLGMLMSSLGQMIFSTALPTLVGELGGVDHMSWVITIFMVTMTIGMPIYGKLGDQIGRKPLYVTAIVLFLIGSTAGALATSMNMMILARGIQGAGAGGLMIGAQSIIADIIPARERGKYMGIMGSIFGLSSVLGPLLGGFFTDGPGWRWALWFNLPLGLTTLGMVIAFMRLPRRTSPARFDFLGATLMAVATSSLILFVTWGGREYEWASGIILGLIAATIIATAALIVVEIRSPNPLIPMSLFRTRNFTLSTLAGVIVGVVMFGTLAYLPTYMQMVHDLSPTAAGLMMIPMMAGLIITSTVAGRRVSATGHYKWYPVVGLVIVSTAMMLIGQLNAKDSLVRVGLALAVMGIGLGLVMQILVLIVQNAFPITMVGTATATNNFFRQIGGALGAAVIGSIFTHRLQELVGPRLRDAQEFLASAGAGQGASAAGAGSAGGAMNDAAAGGAGSAMNDAAAGSAGAGGSGGISGGLSSMTPSSVHNLPAPIHDAIVSSYNDALVPVLFWLFPIALLAACIAAFNREDTLKETVS